MIRRATTALLAAIVLVIPFGEGGRDPRSLFVVHTLALLLVVPFLLGRGPLALADGRHRFSSFPWAPGIGIAAVGLVLLSGARAGYPFAAVLGAWDLLLPFLLFLSIAARSPEEGELRNLGAVLVASTTLQAVLALARYPGGGPMAAGAGFLNPNHLAAFLNLGFFVCASATLAAPRGRGRLLGGGLAGLHLLAIFLLESRGALGALVAGLLLLLGRRDLSPRARRIAAAAVLICALAAGGVIVHRFARVSDPYRYTRAEIWSASARMIGERPLLGFGPGMFPHVADRFNFPIPDGPIRLGRRFEGAHCAWLTLAAECGLPAAFLIVTALLLAVARLVRARSDTGLPQGIGLGLAALLAHGCVEDLQSRPALTIVPAILLGLASAARRRSTSAAAGPFVEGPGRVPARRSPAWIAACGTLLSYVFLVVVLLPYLADREAAKALSLGREGLGHMQRAARLNPLQPEYRNDLGMAVLNSGPPAAERYAEAFALIEEARRLKPVDDRFPLHLARLEQRFAGSIFADGMGESRAAALYREAVRLAPLDPRPRLELAAFLLGVHRSRDALGVAQEALALEPGFLRARILESSILLDMGRREEARRSLEKAEASRSAIAGYSPDSGYAKDIVADAGPERERLWRDLRGAQPATSVP